MDNNTRPPVVGVDAKTSPAPLKYHERARKIMASGLTSTQRFILLAVSDHINATGAPVWPSLSRLSRLTGYSDRTIQRNLSSMEVAKVLEVTRAEGRANRYTISWDHLTPDTVSPPTQCHPRHSVTPPPTQCHPTPDTVSPEAGKERIRETDTPLSPPEGGTPSEELEANPQKILEGWPVDKSVGAVENPAATTATTPAQQALIPSKADPDSIDATTGTAVPVSEVWQMMESIRCDAMNADPNRKRRVSPCQLGEHRRNLSARLRDYSAEDVLMVARWLWTSPHSRAQKLRAPGYRYVTMLRPTKFKSYLDMAREGAEVDPFASQTSKAATPSSGGSGSSATDSAAEAWKVVQSALQAWGVRAPHGAHRWTFDDDKAVDARYCQAIMVATRCDNLGEAWVYLHNNIRNPDRGPALRRSFGYGWRTARFSEVAA